MASEAGSRTPAGVAVRSIVRFALHGIAVLHPMSVTSYSSATETNPEPVFRVTANGPAVCGLALLRVAVESSFPGVVEAWLNSPFVRSKNVNMSAE